VFLAEMLALRTNASWETGLGNEMHTNRAWNSHLQSVAKQLFFIVGCGRSGTSLLQMMVRNHPAVTLPNETGYYSMLYRRYRFRYRDPMPQARFEELVRLVGDFSRVTAMEVDISEVLDRCSASPLTWDTLFLALLDTYRSNNGALRVGEKSPRHLLWMEELSQRFPQSKFIHVIRDPRAVVASQIRAPFSSTHVGALALKWKRSVEFHFTVGRSLGGRYMAVRYEDLVTNPMETLRGVMDHIGIQATPDMLDFYLRDDPAFTPEQLGHMQNTLRPVFTSAIERWMDELDERSIADVEWISQRGMRHLGYEPVTPGSGASALRVARDIAFDAGFRVRRRLLA
jgi:hypothetical protein